MRGTLPEKIKCSESRELTVTVCVQEVLNYEPIKIALSRII